MKMLVITAPLPGLEEEAELSWDQSSRGTSPGFLQTLLQPQQQEPGGRCISASARTFQAQLKGEFCSGAWGATTMSPPPTSDGTQINM